MSVRTASALCTVLCCMQAVIAAHGQAQTPPPGFYDWTGAYVGAHLGYGLGSINETVSGVSSSQSLSGAIAGGQIGANWQYRNLVFGIETDADWSQQQGSGTLQAVSLPWLATARMRVGADFDRIQFYATGGAAYGKVTTTAISGTVSGSTRTGWIAGVGQESIKGNIAFRLEALYVQLPGSVTSTDTGTAISMGSFSGYLVRIGVNYKFGWPAN